MGRSPTELAPLPANRPIYKEAIVDRRLLDPLTMRSRWLALVVTLGLMPTVSACITPTIPIPPPSPALIDFDVTPTIPIPPPSTPPATAVMTYPATSAYVGSTAYVFDNTNGRGVFQRANTDGSIGPTLALPVALGDEVIISVTSASQETVSTCVILQQGAQAGDCP
jgi:hypothetical protein